MSLHGAVARLVQSGGTTPVLNRLTDLAARLLGAESAQVSIIDGGQTVVGGTGVAAEFVGVRSDAADSLCTVTVQSDAPVVIEETAGDERVRHLPPVRSGVAAAYLGVPLRLGGVTVGALCVFSSRPRSWTAADTVLLEELAGPTVRELEWAAAESRHHEDRLLWEVAVEAAGVGAFDWDLRSDELRWDDRLLSIFGQDRDTFGATIHDFDAAVHPADRPEVSAALEQAIATCGPFRVECRIVRPDQTTRWVSARGRVLTDMNGEPERVIGAAFDTTAVQEGETRVARTLNSMPTAYYHLDPEWRFTFVNAEARLLLDALEEEPVGAVVWDLLPALRGTVFERTFRDAVASGDPREFEAFYPAPFDSWYEVRCWPSSDGLSVYLVDVGERHAAQALLRRDARRAALTARVTEALSATLDAREASARLARILVPELADWCVVTLADGRDHQEPAADRPRRLRDLGWWHHDAAARALLDARDPAVLVGDLDPALRALRSGETVLIDPDPASDPASEPASEPASDPASDPGARPERRWAAVVPLSGRGRIAGVLQAYRDRRPFEDEEVAALEDAATRAGLALDNARLYGDQRELAEGLQRTLLTTPPSEPDHLQIAVRYQPAAAIAQVGGDWYDVFRQRDGATTLVVGDVMGHDTAAAAGMAEFRSLLRGVAVTTGGGPGAVLSHVDQAALTLALDTLATAVVARLEQSGEERDAGLTRLRWSNAGHLPPLVIVPPAAAGLATALPGGDAVLGLGPTERDRTTAHYLWAASTAAMLGLTTPHRTDSVVTLPRGATVLLYTDGLTERRGEKIDDGLARLAEEATTLAPDDDLDGFCDRLLARMRPPLLEDDVALLAVRLHPEG